MPGLIKQDALLAVGGLASEIAEKLIQPGSLIELENMTFPTAGEVQLRLGADSIGTNRIPSGGLAPPEAWQLATHNGALVRLGVPGPDPLMVWTSAAGAWQADALHRTDPIISSIASQQRGPLTIARTPIERGNTPGRDAGTPDFATSGNYGLVVYELGAGSTTPFTVYEDLVDAGTGRRLMHRLAALDGYRPHVVTAAGRALVAMVGTGGVIKFDIFDLTTVTDGEPLISASISNASSNSFLDLRVKGGSTVQVLYQEQTTNRAIVAEINISNGSTLASYYLLNSTGGFIVPTMAMSWVRDLAGAAKLAIVEANATSGLRVHWNFGTPTAGTPGSSTAAATYVMDGTATANVRNVTAFTTTTATTGEFQTLHELTAVPDTRGYVVFNERTVATGIGSPSPFLRGVALKSHPFKLPSGDVMVHLASLNPNSANQYLAHVGDGKFSPQAVFCVGASNGRTERTSHLSSVVTLAASKLLTPTTVKTRIDFQGGGFFFDVGVDLVEIQPRLTPDTTIGRPIQVAGQLLVPGGTPLAFDGYNYAESHYAQAPVAPVLTQVSYSGTDALSDGEYTYRAVFARTDASGRVWRSAPSAPVRLTTDASHRKINVVIEQPRLDGHRGKTQVELYRGSVANSVELHRIAVFEADASLDVLSTYTDAIPDAIALLGETLYTTGGGIKPNAVIGSVLHVASANGRVFFVPSEDPTAVWFSDPTIDLQHGLYFHEDNALDVKEERDPITGLGVLGSYVVVFKRSTVYVIDPGLNVRRLEQSGIGTTNAASIVATSSGVWFMSTSERGGIHRVTPSLGIEYVGQGVRKYNSLQVTAAVYSTQHREIRFYTSSGRTLVFHEMVGLWGTNTEQPATCATIADLTSFGGVIYARPLTDPVPGLVGESGGAYQEAGRDYDGRIAWPWLQAAGLAGVERVYRFQGVGETLADHSLVWKLYRDFRTTPFQVTAAKNVLTSDADFPLWQPQVKPKVQKVSALKVELNISRPVADVVIPLVGGGGAIGASVTVDGAGFTSSMAGRQVVVTGPIGSVPAGTYTIVSVDSSSSITVTPSTGLSEFTEFAPGSTVTVLDVPSGAPGPGPKINALATRLGLKQGLRQLNSRNNAK